MNQEEKTDESSREKEKQIKEDEEKEWEVSLETKSETTWKCWCFSQGGKSEDKRDVKQELSRDVKWWISSLVTTLWHAKDTKHVG